MQSPLALLPQQVQLSQVALLNGSTALQSNPQRLLISHKTAILLHYLTSAGPIRFTIALGLGYGPPLVLAPTWTSPAVCSVAPVEEAVEAVMYLRLEITSSLARTTLRPNPWS